MMNPGLAAGTVANPVVAKAMGPGTAVLLSATTGSAPHPSKPTSGSGSATLGKECSGSTLHISNEVRAVDPLAAWFRMPQLAPTVGANGTTTLWDTSITESIRPPAPQ